MTTDPPPDRWPEDLDHLLALCASCRQLRPDGQQCPCLVDRAFVLAEIVHEVTRVATPAWRRPRSWDDLPETARQERTAVLLDVVETVEDAGWRMVSTLIEGRHVPNSAPVDEDATPPTGMSHVRDVVR